MMIMMVCDSDDDNKVRKIPETLIRHSCSKPYLESTLQYFSVSHWLTSNENILVKEKKN